jgi:hypothetical protein
MSAPRTIRGTKPVLTNREIGKNTMTTAEAAPAIRDIPVGPKITGLWRGLDRLGDVEVPAGPAAFPSRPKRA